MTAPATPASEGEPTMNEVRSSEELGLEPGRAELTAALDTSGSVVLINAAGDIVFYAADGKMEIQRRGSECHACISTNLKLAEAVASAWNEKLQRDAAPIPKRCSRVVA